jgi:GTPase SAR1 family protein
MNLYENFLATLERIEVVFSTQRLGKTWDEECTALIRDVKDNSRVLVMGEFNAGKSSFLNALLGKEWLATDVTPATAMVTALQYGSSPSLEAVMKDGQTMSLDFGLLHSISAEGDPEAAKLRGDIHYLKVQLPSELLKTITLVDTPGLNSVHDHHTKATKEFLQKADDVIWLFRYGAIGRMSEIQSIEQIKEHGILPLGIVNAIDIHYEQTDEDLDELLQREQRRLRPYIRELIGVSALDALEGILEDNAEKREWSNFSDLSLSLNQMQQLKLRRLMRVVIRFMENFAEQLEELVRQDNPGECDTRLCSFLLEMLPLHQNHQKQLHNSLLELKSKSSALNILSKPEPSFEAVLHQLEKVDVEVKKDFVKLSNQFKSIKRFHESNVQNFGGYRDATVAEYKMVAGMGIGRIKQLFASKKKLHSINRRLASLENKRQNCENSRETISNYQSSFDFQLSKLADRLEVEINLKKSQYQSYAGNLIKQYAQKLKGIQEGQEEDVHIIEQYLFLIPLVDQLEQLWTTAAAAAAGYEQNQYYIDSFTNSLLGLIDRLRAYIPSNMLDRYLSAIHGLEDNGTSISIEDKLPYSLKSNISGHSDSLTYTPVVPGMFTLKTAYIRPYFMTVVLLGALFATGWTNREWAMSWLDELNPTKQTEAVKEAHEEPVQPQTIGIVTIIAAELNMRNGPDLNAKVIGTVKKGESYAVLAEQNGLLLIGDHAWISGKADYVSFELTQ